MVSSSAINEIRSEEQMIATALAPACEENSDGYWSAVRELQNRMSAAMLEKMQEHIFQGNERERQFAADVIAQGRAAIKEFSPQCVKILLHALEREKSSPVLAAIANALGHHGSAEAIVPLVKLQNHPDANVRQAVVHGLSGQDESAAIKALIVLSTDRDREVRNWATFGLGSMTEMDSAKIREALLARVDEPDEEISGEALLGLTLRGDTRVIEPLLAAINASCKKPEGCSWLLIEAAEVVRVSAAKYPDKIWQKVVARCEDLGFYKSNN
jgi:HEAT repeat protein